MKLLFFSVTKHQYRYFQKLKTHIPFESEHTFFPSINISLKGLFLHKSLDTHHILETKKKEIDKKYTNSLHKKMYMLFLQLQIPWVTAVTYRVIKTLNPDYIILWNGKKFHQAIAVEVAKHCAIKTVFFENGVLPNTTTMDFKGVNATNSLSREKIFYEKLDYKSKNILPQELKIRTSKREQNKFIEPLPERYIFVPFQVAYDTQIIQHSPWIEGMCTFFELIQWLNKHLEIPFVIKEHPSDRVSDYHSLHQQTNDKIYFSSENTQTLIENAQAVMTINSSVAIESLLFDKKVIVLGEAFFAIEGLVKTASSKEQLLSVLENLDSWEINHELISNFLNYLYLDYLIPDNWETPTQKHFDTIANRFKEQV